MDVVLLRCPIGLISMIHTNKGIHEITLDRRSNSQDHIINCKIREERVKVIKHEGQQFEATQKSIEWISNYFENKTKYLNELPKLDNPIFEKENFTSKVLCALYKDVGVGQTVSYAQLAKLCGSPKACRAVGQAMRTNPVPLIVPCHRVISSNGSTGPYMRGNGNNIKKWLITFEQNLVK